MEIETRELVPGLWPDLERLFGKNGACGGCWCQWWRIEKGEKWDRVKGAEAKRRLEKMVLSGEAHGILAYAGGEPIGWCSFDRRLDYPRLDRSPSFACRDAERVWSIPCFFVKAGYRGRGVASAMLAHALRALKRRKAEIAEGYPVKPGPDRTKPIPAAFAWTGTRQMFKKAGFKVVGNRKGGKQRVRLSIGR